MKYEPHDYQIYAAEYIKTHQVSAVFLSMGLGKTSITLTALSDLLFDSFVIHRVLVIAPVRVAKFSWPDELKKWDHLSYLTYAVAVGTPKERAAAVQKGADITIINRENVQWLIEKSGLGFPFDCIVVDELSSFKNHQAKRFRSLMKVRAKASRVIGLTGTPSANGLMDLWAEFRILDMGERLGRFIGQYRTAFFRPDRTNGQIVYSYKPLPGAQEQIYDKISDITISMKAEEHLSMPELISNEYPVFMSDAEANDYHEMAEKFVLELPGGEITAANAGVLSGKLSQMANGAIYTEDGRTIKLHDRKLDALEDIIESANGQPLLIAYWYRHDRERIEERLRKLGIDYGCLDKDESIRRWNRGGMPVALIHPASAGHGLNLQSGGSTIVWFSLTWSLELYQQTVARLWRQGQTSNTVVVMHLVTKGTIDERVLKALSAKDISQSALIEAVKADIGGEKDA